MHQLSHDVNTQSDILWDEAFCKGEAKDVVEVEEVHSNFLD